MRCEYCYERIIAEKEHFSEIDYKKWLELFEKLPPSVIIISGGEPTIYPNFIKLVNNLPKKHLVSLTTNLTASEDFYNKIRREFINITCSMHKSMVNDDFFKKTGILQKLSMTPVVLNFVDYPKQQNLIHIYRDYAVTKNFQFHLEPYIDISELKKSKNKKSCFAGKDYCMILPNGDVWRCNTAFCYHYYIEPCQEYFMGNVFSPEFKFLAEEKTCDIECKHGCDLDFVGRI